MVTKSLVNIKRTINKGVVTKVPVRINPRLKKNAISMVLIILFSV